MYRRIDLIVNPVSGRSKIGRHLREIARRAEQSGVELAVHRTEAAGQATELSRKLGGGGGLLVAVGGDGTVREVAAGAVGLSSPMAVLPTGTENIFARRFGYRNDVDAFWRLLKRGRRRAIDVGTCNGRHFLTVVGVGFDGLAVEHLQRVRRGHISHLHYVRPVWQTFCEYGFPAIRVAADEEPVFAGRAIAFVGNLARYAMGLHILQKARCDDGLLDVCVYACSRRSRLLVHSWWTLLGRHLRSAAVVYRQARRVCIESDARVPVECDGDAAGTLPVDVRILPERVTLLLPPQARVPAESQRTVPCRPGL